MSPQTEALDNDLAALRSTLPLIEASGSRTTTIDVSMLRRLFDAAAAREEGARLAREERIDSEVRRVYGEGVGYIPKGAAGAGDSPYGWHGNGDLCLGSECGVVDADGDHPMVDVHSNDWYEGYEAGQRAGAGDSGGIDVERLAAAIRQVWAAGHSDLGSGLTTDPAAATLAAAIAQEYGR